jgi:phage terminase large subunit
MAKPKRTHDQEIKIPNDWEPMRHQWPFIDAMSNKGYKRAVVVWHRRAGKDSSSLNFTATQAFTRPGVYWHMLPTALQARKVVWDSIDKKGRRVIDQVFPPPVRKSVNNQEMKMELEGGSIWQCVGSDNYDSLVGSNPVGVVFSEYSIANPAAWDYIRPILAENGGWAIFIYTPRGRNAGYNIFKMAENNPNWYCQKLSIDDTDVISPEVLAEERAAGMSEAMIQQEFYCAFDVPIEGAYFGPQLNKAHADGRVCRLPIEPNLPVYTAWDLGIGDAMAIWFVQCVGKEIRLVHYYEHTGEGLAHYINYLMTWAKENMVRYDTHFAPHDIQVRELSSGKSRLDTAREMGIRFSVVKRHKIDDGIEAVRRLFPRFYINETQCEKGLIAMSDYTKVWDEKKMIFQDKPLHNYASHGCDALRYFAMGFRESMLLGNRPKFDKPAVAKADFDVFG